MFDSTDLGISWDTGLMIDAIWLVILMHILSDKISIVLPEIQPSETSWPLWTHTSSHAHLCCTNPYAHMHTRMHMSIHNFLGLYCVWRKGLPLFLPGKQSSNSELPISSHSHAKKKKIPNAVKRKLGIIVYDRNVNFVKKKKMSVLPVASGLGCLIHLLSQQLQALCQTPHLLPCAVSISQNPIGACCRH